MRLRKYSKLNKKLNTAVTGGQSLSKSITANMNEFVEVNNRMLDDFANLDEVISDIDVEFARQTSIINSKDQVFLWVAVALQTVRWVLLPSLEVDDIKPNYDDRNDAEIESKKEDKKNSDWYKKNKDKESKEDEYIPWKDYFERPVPYDALNGKGVQDMEIDGVTDKGKNLGSKNHHSATLGHDPILGYIFGSINIMTSTITFHKALFPTNHVEFKGVKEQEVMEPVGFASTVIKVMDAEVDDKFRVPAAVARQALHMASDEMSRTGLPIPFLSAKKQQELLMKGWNSKELDRIIDSLKKHMKGNLKIVAAQFFIALFINMVIKTLHILMYDEKKDGSSDLYNVRTHRILTVSNTIASSLNIAYVAKNTAAGVLSDNPELIKKGLTKMDIGGYIETVHQIVSSKKLQEQIRREYLEKQLHEKFFGENYSFLEDDLYVQERL